MQKDLKNKNGYKFNFTILKKTLWFAMACSISTARALIRGCEVHFWGVVAAAYPRSPHRNAPITTWKGGEVFEETPQVRINGQRGIGCLEYVIPWVGRGRRQMSRNVSLQNQCAKHGPWRDHVMWFGLQCSKRIASRQNKKAWMNSWLIKLEHGWNPFRMGFGYFGIMPWCN